MGSFNSWQLSFSVQEYAVRTFLTTCTQSTNKWHVWSISLHLFWAKYASRWTVPAPTAIFISYNASCNLEGIVALSMNFDSALLQLNGLQNHNPCVFHLHTQLLVRAGKFFLLCITNTNNRTSVYSRASETLKQNIMIQASLACCIYQITKMWL